MWHVTCDTWHVRHVTCEAYHVTHDMWNVTHDMWHMAHGMWHVTHDMWRMTCDMWHVTCDTWHMTCCRGWTFSNKFSFIALTVWDLWYLEDLGEKDHWLTRWMNKLITEVIVHWCIKSMYKVFALAIDCTLKVISFGFCSVQFMPLFRISFWIPRRSDTKIGLQRLAALKKKIYGYLKLIYIPYSHKALKLQCH